MEGEVKKPLIANTFVKAYVGGHLNKWFETYSDAKAEQKVNGGFLMPYKHQFFICDADYLAMFGLDPKDPDWTSSNLTGQSPPILKHGSVCFIDG